MPFLLVWIFFALVVAVVASSRGRSGIGWFLLALVITPLVALVLVALMPSRTAVMVVNGQPTLVRPQRHWGWGDTLGLIVILLLAWYFWGGNAHADSLPSRDDAVGQGHTVAGGTIVLLNSPKLPREVLRCIYQLPNGACLPTPAGFPDHCLTNGPVVYAGYVSQFGKLHPFCWYTLDGVNIEAVFITEDNAHVVYPVTAFLPIPEFDRSGRLVLSQPAPQQPAPSATPSVAPKEKGSAYFTPLPTIRNTDHDCILVAASFDSPIEYRPCNDVEFAALLKCLRRQWNIVPEWVRGKCAAQSSVNDIEGCFKKQINFHELPPEWLGQILDKNLCPEWKALLDKEGITIK